MAGLRVYNANQTLKTDLIFTDPTANSTITVPNKNMTVAGLDDIRGNPNHIINGNFDRWQYKDAGMTYPQTSSGYGSDDRWTNGNTGSTKTHSQVACTDTERALFNAAYFSRTAVTSVAGASNGVWKFQAIENITKLAGKTVTLSFWAKADTVKNIALEFNQLFGTGGTPTATLFGISPQLIALTTSWQKFSVTVTIPSIVGKTLGTDGPHTSYTGVTFWMDAGSTFASRTASLGQQSGTFDIAQVKLEEGSFATPWTPYQGEFGGEFYACKRYCEAIACSLMISTPYPSGGNQWITVPFKVTKRIVPSHTIISSNWVNATPSIDSISKDMISFFATGATQFYYASAGSPLLITCEL